MKKNHRKSLLRSKWFWNIISLFAILLGFVVWNSIELNCNSGVVAKKNSSLPIAVLPNNVSYGPIVYTEDSVMFKIDTGMPYSLLSEESAKRYKAASKKPVLSAMIDINGHAMIRFGKVKIDTLVFVGGNRLENAEFVVGGSKNFIGMDILRKHVLVFERVGSALDSVNVYLLPSRPEVYTYKIADIGYRGGYLRDYHTIRPYVDLEFDSISNRYFMDTQTSTFKMPLADSAIVKNRIVCYGECTVGGMNNSAVLKRYMDFKYACEYKVNGENRSSENMGELMDYITKYAFNPSEFFPFSVAIDFLDNAIYAAEPIADFKLTTGAY